MIETEDIHLFYSIVLSASNYFQVPRHGVGTVLQIIGSCASPITLATRVVGLNVVSNPVFEPEQGIRDDIDCTLYIV